MQVFGMTKLVDWAEPGALGSLQEDALMIRVCATENVAVTMAAKTWLTWFAIPAAPFAQTMTCIGAKTDRSVSTRIWYVMVTSTVRTSLMKTQAYVVRVQIHSEDPRQHLDVCKGTQSCQYVQFHAMGWMTFASTTWMNNAKPKK